MVAKRRSNLAITANISLSLSLTYILSGYLNEQSISGWKGVQGYEVVGGVDGAGVHHEDDKKLVSSDDCTVETITFLPPLARRTLGLLPNKR